MERMKNRLWEAFGRKFYEKTRASFAGYAVSLISIAVTTICSVAVFVMSEKYIYIVSIFDEPVLGVINRGLICFCFGAVFAETYFAGKKKGKLYALIAAAVIAVLTALGTLGADLSVGADPPAAEEAYFTGSVLSELSVRFLYGYLLLLALGTVYFCYKRSGIGFPEYVLRVFSNQMKVFIVFWLLSFGTLFIVGIVNTLLISDRYSDFGYYLEILLIGLYFAPMSLAALRDMTNEPGAFLRTIIKYILLLMSACGMAIVYFYVVKIVLLWEVPSNEVFSIVSALFCFGMPVWLMAEYYADNGRYYKVFSKLPYMFAPLILLQLYSMIVRIGQYGVTPERYMGMMLLLFETGTLLIWHFRKEKREKMLAFLCLLVFIAFFAPGINMYRLSSLCQQSFLKKYYQKVLDGEELSQLEYGRLKGSYQYLKNQEQTKAVAEQYSIAEEDFVPKLNEMEISDSSLNQFETHRIHCCQMVGELDVEDWQNLNMLNQADCYNEKSDGLFEAVYPNQDGEKKTAAYGSGYRLDFTAYQFVKRETGEIITVDISDFAWECMLYETEHPDADSQEISEAMKQYNRIRIDENTVLFLNHFEIRYSEGIQHGEPYFEWHKPTISGILLTK